MAQIAQLLRPADRRTAAAVSAMLVAVALVVSMGDPGRFAWIRMTALVLVALASCTRRQGEEGVTPPLASPPVGDVSSSPQSSAEFLGRITDCEGLRVPRVELDTELDRRAGLLTVNYTTRRDAQNRSFTIAYDDPSCGQNPEVQKLLRNVGVCRLFEPFLQCALRRLHALRVRLEHVLDREA